MTEETKQEVLQFDTMQIMEMIQHRLHLHKELISL